MTIRSILLAAALAAPAGIALADGATSVQLGLREARDVSEAELYLRRDTEAGFGPVRVVYGASITESGAVWAGVGLQAVFGLGGGWAVEGSVMPGLRHDGSGPDLGHPVQVRSALAISRGVGPGRLALGVDHLSNAALGDMNPGSDSLFLRWTFAR